MSVDDAVTAKAVPTSEFVYVVELSDFNYNAVSTSLLYMLFDLSDFTDNDVVISVDVALNPMVVSTSDFLHAVDLFVLNNNVVSISVLG